MLPKELQNNVKFIDSLEETLHDEEENLDINSETLLNLGGVMEVGNIKLPPPTAGVVMLLELIDSPFITGGDKFTLDDIFKALYVINRKQEAVPPIMIQLRTERKAKEAFEKTDKTPEHLEVYNRFIERNAMNAGSFDSEVAEFACEIGNIDPIAVSELISDYITVSMGGFATLPSNETGGKKKDLIPSG